MPRNCPATAPQLPRNASAAERDETIDALRVLALAGTVLGHGLVTGFPTGSALVSHPELRPATWVLQTLGPLFFAAGFAATRRAPAASDGRPCGLLALVAVLWCLGGPVVRLALSSDWPCRSCGSPRCCSRSDGCDEFWTARRGGCSCRSGASRCWTCSARGSVGWAGFPASAVGTPGVPRSPSNPPGTVAVALGVARTGFFGTVAPVLRELLRGAGWPARVNRWCLPVYLVHLPLLCVLGVLGFPGVGGDVAADGWLGARAVVLPALAAMVFLLSAGLGQCVRPRLRVVSSG